jgi:thymidylate synthase (FAD)
METSLKVKLLSHSKLSVEFLQSIKDMIGENDNGKAVSLSAIRTCYSPNKPSEIIPNEGHKYFGNTASDGKGGSEADRLIRMIVNSGHTSTLEHVTFTFSVEGISRACLAQLTRHRFFSFSVQSQRYVRLGSGDRSGGFDYIMPESIENNTQAKSTFNLFMQTAQAAYDALRLAGIPAEDARSVLPNAAATNLTLTTNLRALLDFYSKRKKGNGAQAEIAALAENLKAQVVAVEQWTKPFFDGE